MGHNTQQYLSASWIMHTNRRVLGPEARRILVTGVVRSEKSGLTFIENAFKEKAGKLVPSY